MCPWTVRRKIDFILDSSFDILSVFPSGDDDPECDEENNAGRKDEPDPIYLHKP
jgi:hypothetical protein